MMTLEMRKIQDQLDRGERLVMRLENIVESNLLDHAPDLKAQLEHDIKEYFRANEV